MCCLMVALTSLVLTSACDDKKEKVKEAHINVQKICEGASAFFQKDQNNNSGYPVPSAEKTFAVGEAKCGEITWTHEKVPGKEPAKPDIEFTTQLWQDLSFSIDEPSYYRYGYKVSCETGEESTFTAYAEGDLNGDGVLSKFERSGKVVDMEPVISDIKVENELE